MAVLASLGLVGGAPAATSQVGAAVGTATPNCGQTSVPDLYPLNDLGRADYTDPQGTHHQGGLYQNGSNFIPPDHLASGIDLAQGIQPLDAGGAPDPVAGKYVLLSIGLSITTLEFQAFVKVANDDPARDPHLMVVDGAKFGADAHHIADPANAYWGNVDTALANQGLSPDQVAVLWVKVFNGHIQEPTDDPTPHFSPFVEGLHDDLVSILQIARQRYPNVRLAYMTSRSYGGYASTDLSPEPYANWTGYAMRQVILDQIGGSSRLDFTNGTAPWVAWGPYWWANGMTPRRDGLTWSCEDFRSDDGQHPARKGQAKAAGMLDSIFDSDPTARQWFQASPVAPALNLSLKPGRGLAGSTTTVTGAGFAPYEEVRLTFPNGSGSVSLGTVIPAACGYPTPSSPCSPLADGAGRFSVQVQIPSDATVGRHPIRARGSTSGVTTKKAFTVVSPTA